MDDPSEFKEQPYSIRSPLTGERVLVSPRRVSRPWEGSSETVSPELIPPFDPQCPLCPGVIRAGGERNPAYQGTFCFTNDHAAVTPRLSEVKDSTCALLEGIIKAEAQYGTCRVICFSPRHDVTLAELGLGEITAIIETWANEFASLARRSDVLYVTIFENKGKLMGCSQPHPHCQIWSTSTIPFLPEQIIRNQVNYFRKNRSHLLATYLRWELRHPGHRVVLENNGFVALVPPWAKWPFEVLVLPRFWVNSVSTLTGEQRAEWADVMLRLTRGYDRLFNCSMPYTMWIFQRPTDSKNWPELELFQVFEPPLLRSATVQKFMVGFERGGQPQRDLPPEEAARRLRECVVGRTSVS